MGLKLYTFKVQPGGEEIPALTGDYIRVEKASVPVRLRTENGDDFMLDEGEEANISRFQRLIIGHEGAGEETIRLFVGDNGARVGSAKVSGSVDVPGGVAINNPIQKLSALIGFQRVTVSSAAGVLIASSPARSFLLIKNQHDFGSIWIKPLLAGGATQVGTGWKLGPGETLELKGVAVFTGQLQAVGDIASNADVILWEC